jgi:putative glycosyltransferase
MKLSIVTTLYKSQAHVEKFCLRACNIAQSIVGEDFEVILVNDGSPDDSFKIAKALSQSNHHITLIDLSRNFGHHRAMMTGLTQASGNLIYLLDSDLEEEPEWLTLFLDRMISETCDVVYGVQQVRAGNFSERFLGRFFYHIFRLLTGLSLPSNIVVARIMSRRYVQALLRHEEREVFMAGLWHITGFKQVPFPVIKHNTSKTTYTFRHKVSMFINSITAFTNLPLISIFYTGIAISLLSWLYTSTLIVNKIVFHIPLNGWTSVMASIWILGGRIISFIGIIGIYLSKVFSETKRRPYTMPRTVTNKK